MKHVIQPSACSKRVAAAQDNAVAVFALTDRGRQDAAAGSMGPLGYTAMPHEGEDVSAVLWVAFSCPSSLGVASDACLLVGTTEGYIELLDKDGSVMLRQRLHMGPVLSLQLSSWCMGACSLSSKGLLLEGMEERSQTKPNTRPLLCVCVRTATTATCA